MDTSLVVAGSCMFWMHIIAPSTPTFTSPPTLPSTKSRRLVRYLDPSENPLHPHCEVNFFDVNEEYNRLCRVYGMDPSWFERATKGDDTAESVEVRPDAQESELAIAAFNVIRHHPTQPVKLVDMCRAYILCNTLVGLYHNPHGHHTEVYSLLWSIHKQCKLLLRVAYDELLCRDMRESATDRAALLLRSTRMDCPRRVWQTAIECDNQLLIATLKLYDCNLTDQIIVNYAAEVGARKVFSSMAERVSESCHCDMVFPFRLAIYHGHIGIVEDHLHNPRYRLPNYLEHAMNCNQEQIVRLLWPLFDEKTHNKTLQRLEAEAMYRYIDLYSGSWNQMLSSALHASNGPQWDVIRMSIERGADKYILAEWSLNMMDQCGYDHCCENYNIDWEKLTQSEYVRNRGRAFYRKQTGAGMGNLLDRKYDMEDIEMFIKRGYLSVEDVLFHTMESQIWSRFTYYGKQLGWTQVLTILLGRRCPVWMVTECLNMGAKITPEMIRHMDVENILPLLREYGVGFWLKHRDELVDCVVDTERIDIFTNIADLLPNPRRTLGRAVRKGKYQLITYYFRRDEIMFESREHLAFYIAGILRPFIMEMDSFEDFVDRLWAILKTGNARKTKKS